MSTRTAARTVRRLIGGAISGFGLLLLARDALSSVPVLLASLSN